MARACYRCDCKDNGIRTQPLCDDSYPKCKDNYPCEATLYDLCVLDINEGYIIENNQSTFYYPGSLSLLDFKQWLLMFNDGSLNQYCVYGHQYGPILGLRPTMIGERTFSIIWNYPYVMPDPDTTPTQWAIYVKELNNPTPIVLYLIDTGVNWFTVFDYGGLVYQSNTSYIVQVRLIKAGDPSTIYSESIKVIIKTK